MTHPRMLPLLACVLFACTAATPARKPASPPIPFPPPSQWAKRVSNPYLPLRPGMTWVYATREGAVAGVDSVEVLRTTKTILGVPAVVVRDRTYAHGALSEDSYDWYAQDAAGNVWYLGEDTREYRAGKLAGTAGSWEAGRNGAQAGIVMWAHPSPGEPYRQEYRRGVAEDMARVLGVDAKVDLEGAGLQHCVQTEEWSPLEPGVREHKFYARGVGLVRMVSVAGPHEEMRLVTVGMP